ncbi:hypothetical protein Taro_048975 [Colocasia esculenta]|uniref:Uncharacterized protein n=1 Tax=Colocasia esculenta TaxID=4460 RepID=A0A843X9L6_COLES|nr:hypothetical protein [Colocasia esculenta]
MFIGAPSCPGGLGNSYLFPLPTVLYTGFHPFFSSTVFFPHLYQICYLFPFPAMICRPTIPPLGQFLHRLEVEDMDVGAPPEM